MNDFLALAKGGFKKFALPLLICMILVPFTGIHFDSYEGLFACFVSGDYFSPITDKEIDLHLFLLPVYAFFNKHVPNHFVYGLILFAYFLIALMYAYHVAHRFMCSMRLDRKYLLLILISAIFAAFGSSLSTIKVATIFAATLVLDVYLHHRLDDYGWKFYLKIALATLFICLLRLDVAVMLSVVLSLTTLLLKLNLRPLMTVLSITLLVFTAHKYLLSKTTEPKKIFFYKEYDLFDRGQVNYENLTPKESMTISLLCNLAITDTLTFNPHLINKATSSDDMGVKSLFSIGYDSAMNIFAKSRKDIQTSISFIILSVITLIIALYFERKPRIRILYTAIFLMPLAVSFYSITPDRFLISYYSAFAVIAIIQISSYHKVVGTSLGVMLALVCLQHLIKNKQLNKNAQIEYEDNCRRLEHYHQSGEIPIIENLDYSFFPKDIFSSRPRYKALFLNAYLFNSYDAYLKEWMSYGVRNPLSLEEKLDFVSRNNLPLIMSKERKNVYKLYFSEFYGLNIEFRKEKTFDEKYNAYEISLSQN